MKILLVDDDELFRTMISRTLSKQDHNVIIANDGDGALAKAQQENFDLVITDIFMPSKEGIEVIQEIREIQPDVKIIAISSDGITTHSSFLKIAEASGADICLRKPFNPAQLLEKIAEITAA
jgi:CheY-like chemotaxis protein